MTREAGRGGPGSAVPAWRERAHRAGLSLFGFGCGVLAGATAMLAMVMLEEAEGFSNGRSWIEHASTDLMLVAWFAAPIWLLAMLPLSLRISREAPLLRGWRVLAFGAFCGACGAGIEVVLFALPGLFALLAIGLGALVGAAAWSVFAWLLVRRSTLDASAPAAAGAGGQ